MKVERGTRRESAGGSAKRLASRIVELTLRRSKVWAFTNKKNVVKESFTTLVLLDLIVGVYLILRLGRRL